MRRVTLTGTEFVELSAEVLGKGGCLRFEARGTSMSPFIRDRDILIVQPADIAFVGAGDVAFYRTTGGRVVAHRVVAAKTIAGRPVLIARGDSDSGPGEPVEAEQLLGKITGIVRNGKACRLDGSFERAAVSTWTRLRHLRAPLAWVAMTARRVAHRALTSIQSSHSYRALARRSFGRRARCRVAGTADVDALARLYGTGSFPELRSPTGAMAVGPDAMVHSHILIAFVGDRVAGATTVCRYPQDQLHHPDWWLFGMVVRARYRGGGVGELMLHAAVEKVRERGGARMHLLVFDGNAAAAGLYLNAGFRRGSIPALDAQLEEEVRTTGRRRIILSLDLNHA